MPSRKLPAPLHTLVQHSGFVVTNHEEFRKAVESRRVSTEDEKALVEEAGGFLFDTYNDAEAECETQNYGPSNITMVPRAPGRFCADTLNGLPIYIAADEGSPA